MENVSFKEIMDFQKKSKIKAGEGLPLGEGKYPFYTSSPVLSKSINVSTFEGENLVFGTGGLPSIHFAEGNFASSTDCLVTKVKDDNQVFAKFVYYYLNGNINILADGFKGAGLKHISKEYIENIKIPLPELSVQKKIAAILDKAAEIRETNQQIVDKYEQLKQSLFLEMFGDPVKNEKGWEVKKLGDLSKIKTGPFGSMLHVEDYVENGTPLVNPTHIVNGLIKENYNFSIDDDKLEELKGYQLIKNDIVLGRRGEMGRCAVVTERENGFLCGTGSLIIRPQSDLNSFFLFKVLSSPQFKSILENKANGVTMKNLNSKIIENLSIPFPEPEIQNKFEKSLNLINSQIISAEHSLQKCDNLFNALLQKAFSGNLI